MKKSWFFVILFLISASSFIFPEDADFLKSEGKSDKNVSLDSIDKKLEGKAKLGLSLGYPTGVTFGYQLTEIMEINAAAGIFDFDSISAGVSALFAIVDLEAGDAVFPVTFGPGVYFHTGNREKVDILAVLRIEYDFEEIPLNLYAEGGAGIRIVPDTEAAGSGALGIRYIF